MAKKPFYPVEEPALDYKETLKQLQIELVKLQKQVIKKHEKILIIFEGRDAGGKDGTIKSIVQYLSPRETQVVLLDTNIVFNFEEIHLHNGMMAK